MRKKIEMLFVVASLRERDKGAVGRLVANLLRADGTQEWSASATVRRDGESGRFALGPIVPETEVPGTVLLELQSAIERAWHYGRSITVVGEGRAMGESDAASRLGASSDARPALRAVWPWQEQDKPKDMPT